MYAMAREGKDLDRSGPGASRLVRYFRRDRRDARDDATIGDNGDKELGGTQACLWRRPKVESGPSPHDAKILVVGPDERYKPSLKLPGWY